MPQEGQMSVQEFANSIKAKYPQYASVPDDKLARAMLVKYPQYQSRINRSAASPIAPPALAKPSVPMSEANLIGGDPVRPLSQAVGEMASGQAKSIGNVTLAPYHRLLQKFGVFGPGSRLWPGETSLHDLPMEIAKQGTLAIGTGLVEEGDAPYSRTTRPKLTKNGERISPEQQAKYSHAVDKTNQDFGEKLKGYHEDLNKLFDESKRTQIESQAKHVETTSKIEAENADKMAKYEHKVGQVERRGELTGYQKRYAGIIKNMAERAHENIRGYFNTRWRSLDEANGPETLDQLHIKDVMDESREMLAGQPEDLKIFNDIVKQITVEKSAIDQAGGAEPQLRPMTWQEGRVDYTALGAKRYSTSGNIRRAIAHLQEDGIGRGLNKAATRSGTGREYQLLKRDWSQYMQDWHDMGAIGTGGSPLARILAARDQPYVVRYAMGDASERLEQILDKYKRFGANSVPVKGLKRMAEQADKLPKKAPTRPDLAAMPERPDAIPEAKRNVPSPPKLKPVPRPKIEVPHASKIARHIGSITGALSGGVLGHPLVGAGIGRDIVEQLARRKAPPPPGVWPPE
jgi:hypothetical protein